MRYTNHNLHQAFLDLLDFWAVFKQAFDPTEVEANMLDVSPVTPIPDDAMVEGDRNPVDESDFLLDRRNKNKVIDNGMNPETGVVVSMMGGSVPADFQELFGGGLRELDLKSVVVQNGESSCSPVGIALFIDYTQPNFAEVMSDLHQRLPETDTRIVNHTQAATTFKRYLQEQMAANEIEAEEVMPENIERFAKRAVTYSVMRAMSEAIEQELSSRSYITTRRFNDYLQHAGGVSDGFSIILFDEEKLEDTQENRSMLMRACEKADCKAIRAQVKAEFEKAIEKSMGAGVSRAGITSGKKSG